VEQAQELARPADYDYLGLLQKRFYSLRCYFKIMFDQIDTNNLINDHRKKRVL
jgi:hypothetical protein